MSLPRFRLIPLLLVALLCATAITITSSAPALAAPTATRTAPFDGEILNRMPSAVAIGFDEEIDQQSSSMTLYDETGAVIDGTSIAFDASGTGMTLTLPASLPTGVYTVAWTAVSVEDGSGTASWYSFSAGNPEDAAIVTIPSDQLSSVSSGNLLETIARSLALGGSLLTIAIWPVWTAMIRPSLRSHRTLARRATRASQSIAIFSVALAFLGSLAEALAKAAATSDSNYTDHLMNLIGHTSWGSWWLARIALIAAIGIGLTLASWWWPRRHLNKTITLWLLSLALPIVFAASSHASDASVGHATAVLVDYLHTASAGVWGGGTLLIIGALLALGERARSLTQAIARIWGGLTVWAILTLTLTGIYTANVQIGNTSALTHTSYGTAFIIKIAVVVSSIALAVTILRQWWTQGSGRTTALLLACAIMLVVVATAALNTLAPARDDVTQRATQAMTTIDLGERDAVWLVAPGQVGVNHLRLEVPAGTYIPTESEAYLDVTRPGHPEFGTKTIQLARVSGNNFEHHGTEFSQPGEYAMTIRLALPDAEQQSASLNQAFTAARNDASIEAPDAPWRFNPVGGSTGVVLATIGTLALSTALFTSSTSLRKEAGGLGMVALALGAVVLLQARVDPILAVADDQGAINPGDMAMVARGEEVYSQHCVTCHGVDLRGTGPLNETLNPPATDFAAPHARVHSNEDLVYWITSGKQGTAMPGFGSSLTDQQIRDVIAYIQHWQETADPNATPIGTPGVIASCEVTPLEFSDIPEIFHHGMMPEVRRGTPLVAAADPTVDGETTNDVMWTVEQLVACRNQDIILSGLRLYTPMMLQELYPEGASWELTSETTSAPEPLREGDRITIQDVQSVTMLADGRIAVSAIFRDPTGAGIIPNVAPVSQVTLVLINEDGIWYIDEIR